MKKENASFVSIRKYIIAVLIAIISGCLLFYITVNYKFNNMDGKTLDCLPPHMLWAHAGYTQGFPSNSIQSFDAAEKMGYYGIELDIHFLEGKGLVVAHDLTAKTENSHELHLDRVFERYGDRFYYWLDFKNLNSRTASNSGKLLSGYISKYKLSGRVFVESTRPIALRKLKAAAPGINPIYCLSGGNLRKTFGLFKEKVKTVVSGTDTVAVPVEYAGDSFLVNFQHLNMTVFTVNDRDKIAHLFARGVRIVLLDLDMRSQFPDSYRSSRREP